MYFQSNTFEVAMTFTDDTLTSNTCKRKRLRHAVLKLWQYCRSSCYEMCHLYSSTQKCLQLSRGPKSTFNVNCDLENMVKVILIQAVWMWWKSSSMMSTNSFWVKNVGRYEPVPLFIALALKSWTLTYISENVGHIDLVLGLQWTSA